MGSEQPAQGFTSSSPGYDAPRSPGIAGDGDFPVLVEGGQGRQWVWPVVGLALVALSIAGYRLWFSGGSNATPPETVAVTRTIIRSTIEASGSVESQESASLSFAMTGRVKRVDVKLGDRVVAGQTLALMESDELDNGVVAAEANIQLARLKLTQLLNGASFAEIASAQQIVSAARASRDKADDDVRKLEDGAPSADLDAARAAVTKAEASLAESEDTLSQLRNGASDADVAAAEAGVAAAEASLSSAERMAEDADARMSAAQGVLFSALSTYCLQTLSRPEVCASSAVPLSQSTLDVLVADISSTDDAALARDISAVLTANSSYLTATESAATSEGAVDVARANLDAAEEKADGLNDGADATQIAAAEAAVAAAADGLAAARSRLADLDEGASADEMFVAQSALTAADDTLFAAEAKLADLLDGADEDDIALQRAQVSVAEIAAARARVQQSNARLLAPFGGVVAAINIHPGEYGTPALPAFVVLTPGALRLDLVIGENDRPYVLSGQKGTMTFDAVPNQAYAFVIQNMGDAAKIEQGVATYTAEAVLTIPAGAVRPVTGMGGVAEVLITEKTDVLAIPTRALRRIGREQVVDVMVNGVVEERAVDVGISDGQFVEVVAGLDEGDQVVLRAVSKTAPEALPTRERQLPGGIR